MREHLNICSVDFKPTFKQYDTVHICNGDQYRLIFNWDICTVHIKVFIRCSVCFFYLSGLYYSFLYLFVFVFYLYKC